MTASTRRRHPFFTRADVVGARVLLALAALLGGIVLSTRARLADELGGAWWIGRFEVARLARPATLGLVTRFAFPFDVPKVTLKLRADRHYEAFFDGARIGEGGGAGADAPLDVWEFEGPHSAGEHTLAVFVSHPEGVASLRAGLDAERIGRNCVVTDGSWRVDDDAKRIRERGFYGARYPATLWARPPLSSWEVSSSTRSVRGSVGISRIDVRSRIPSRAATQ